MPNKKKQRKLRCHKKPSGIVDKPMNFHKKKTGSNNNIRQSDIISLKHMVNNTFGKAPVEYKKVYDS